jgi:hypothetical protein
MRVATLAMALALVGAAVAAAAEVEGQTADTARADSAPRYSFNRVSDGFLRLDNVTGNVAYCAPTSAGWACQAVPEDRVALEKEIARLQDEVADLKQQVAVFREPTPPRPPADLTPPGKEPDTAQLRADIARAKAVIKDAWERLVDMINGIQKDMLR